MGIAAGAKKVGDFFKKAGKSVADSVKTGAKATPKAKVGVKVGAKRRLQATEKPADKPADKPAENADVPTMNLSKDGLPVSDYKDDVTVPEDLVGAKDQEAPKSANLVKLCFMLFAALLTMY